MMDVLYSVEILTVATGKYSPILIYKDHLWTAAKVVFVPKGQRPGLMTHQYKRTTVRDLGRRT